MFFQKWVVHTKLEIYILHASFKFFSYLMVINLTMNMALIKDGVEKMQRGKYQVQLLKQQSLFSSDIKHTTIVID